MADNHKLKMKFKLHQLEFELEGNQDVVKEQFENFKSFITNDLLPKVNVERETIQATPKIEESRSQQLLTPHDVEVIEDIDIPALKEIVLKDLPKSETDWILIYACYSTSFGQGTFTEEAIKNHYEQTGRTNRSRSANLSNNIKSLLNKGYIKVHNDTEYLVKPEGIRHAHEILAGKSITKTSTKTSKKATSSKSSSSKPISSKKSNSSASQFSLDRTLNLRPDGKESLKDFATKYQIDSTPKQIVVIVYYLKEILKISSVNGNHIYTSLEELNVRIPKSLQQIIINTKGRNYGWLDYDTMDDIRLSVQGRNAIKHDLLKDS